MSSFDPFTWYVFTSASQSPNNTLTAANNAQAAYDPNSPSAIYYSSSSGDVPNNQQWQLFPVNSSSTTAYVLRNRQIGAGSYLTTAWTTRKCGGGNCATVPVLSPNVNFESLWAFGAWGFSDPTGGAYIYNYGNGSAWRMDVMDDGSSPELINSQDTGRLSLHWNVNAHAKFAASDSSSFASVPSTATTLLAQRTGSTASVTPYSATAAATSTAGSSTGSGAGATATSNLSADQSSGSKGGLSTGGAIGIGVGIGVGVLLIILGIAFFYFRRKQRSKGVGTYRNPAELGAAPTNEKHMHARALNHGSYAEMSTPETAKSPASVARSEMQHPSEHSRSELMHPSDTSRSELEHPSIRTNGPLR